MPIGFWQAARHESPDLVEPNSAYLRNHLRKPNDPERLHANRLQRGHLLYGFASPKDFTMSERTQKHVLLRRRTDQDLLVLVSREIDRGVMLTNLATTRNSPLFVQAEKAYGTATALLNKMAGLSDGDRLRLESSLMELRTLLAQVPVLATAACYLSSVAS